MKTNRLSTDMNSSKRLDDYYRRLKKSNTEQAKKEIFLGLLQDLFGADGGARQIIYGLQEGSEAKVENIPLKHRKKTGSADSQYRSLIIEFERDMRKTGLHAADQLAEYYAGNWKSGYQYEFTLIATDCINWVVYAPTPTAAASLSGIHHVDRKLLTVVEEFSISQENLDSFPSFLDRFIFRLTPQRATIDSVVQIFGDGSLVFLNAVHGIDSIVSKDIPTSPSLQVAMNEWEKLLQVAYGTYQGNTYTFAIHTYLSILSKMLAYQVLTGDQYIDNDELRGILTGEIFSKYNVADFVERDFFGWVTTDEHFESVMTIARVIADRLSDLDFRNVSEDVLKGVYQNLIDVETRHGLGEYYTPDWLCERIVKELDPEPGQSMLDPACGSGSFIRAYNHYIIEKSPEVDLALLAASSFGIDVNPLSVQIAKATKLISLGPRVKDAAKPIRLNIFLANALYTPEQYLSIFDAKFMVSVNDSVVDLSVDMFSDPAQYDQIIDTCDRLANATQNTVPYEREEFHRRLNATTRRNITDLHSGVYYKIYVAFHQAKATGRDSIWKFILQNAYKPSLVKSHFDYVLGNPPWLTFRQITKKDYQDIVARVAGASDIIVKNKKNLPHLELAAVFLAHSASYFLKESGRGVFVMPRSVLSADHHSQLREGSVKELEISAIWDLEKVTKLFPVPSCVLFFSKHTKKLPPTPSDPDGTELIPGLSIKGTLPKHNLSLREGAVFLSESDVEWRLTRLNKKTSLSTVQQTSVNQFNYYKKFFRQGATLVPRSLMFVDVIQGDYTDRENESRLILLQSSEYASREAKRPWDGIKISGRLPISLLYQTPLANSLFPYTVATPSLVVLPAKRVSIDSMHYRLKTVTADELASAGDLDGFEWFQKAESLWMERRTEKSAKYALHEWIDYQNKLSVQVIGQNDFYVCYNASGKDACAAIVQQSAYDRPVIFDAKTYWMRAEDEDEAYYLIAHINSNFANEAIKSFQSRGLFGARDVHTAILDVSLQKYDPYDYTHRRIVELSKKCAQESAAIVSAFDLHNPKSNQLGRIRAHVRKMLSGMRNEIDGLLMASQHV
jgi:hypothetical protein